MNAEEKSSFFLSFVHFCQDVGYGGVKDTVVHENTPLFSNDWYRKIRRDSKDRLPAYFSWDDIPAAWHDFKDFLELSLAQGIIREIKLQDGLPVSWDHPRPSRSAPNTFSKVRRVYVLKDASSLLRYSAAGGAGSQNERSRAEPFPDREEKQGI
ncbi:MAG: hypothetical protein HY922_10290 [Elusimicrobia bacterium]|nr:hypothetical protein [Elusimicrobiota bacterium]